MKIKNPTIECPRVPENLSGFSKLSYTGKTESYSDIIFDTPEEIGEAIIVYGGDKLPNSRATRNGVINQVGNIGGGLAAGLMLLVEARTDGSSFSKSLANEMVGELKSSGHSHQSFEYTSNVFQQTSLTASKVGNKYLLNISAAYVGNEPEQNLALALGKPLALSRATITTQLSIVDDWWFNWNFGETVMLLTGSQSKKNLEGFASYIASGNYLGKPPVIDFKHNDENLTLSMGELTDSRYLKYEKGQGLESYYLKSRNRNIVGGAWKEYDDKGHEISPTPCEPRVGFSVRINRDGTGSQAVTPSETRAVIAARDLYARILEEATKK